ncbi:DUF2812 domain-containing protein [Streptococcus oricebi]|uniref:DUF2812 domain-containing protein n=1 Tax=Streptococcus oricebi TaxID=1547447 RepID=A0ABS5B1S4_9STRE|nr:DUF2812 domain-containing protein [Streptococcus oricebi]MBP2622768.1 hypothetical protein [Streptococcus oricebi]
MMKVVRKAFYDFTKEEAWLNQMSQEGYALVGYKGGKYYFEPSQQGRYQYKIAIANNWKDLDKKAYLEFLESTGVTVVATYLGRAYLARPAAEGDFELYSDLDSQIKQIKLARTPILVSTYSTVVFLLMVILQLIVFIPPFSPAFWALVVSSLIFLIVLILSIRLLIAYSRRMKELKAAQVCEG